MSPLHCLKQVQNHVLTTKKHKTESTSTQTPTGRETFQMHSIFFLVQLVSGLFWNYSKINLMQEKEWWKEMPLSCCLPFSEVIWVADKSERNQHHYWYGGNPKGNSRNNAGIRGINVTIDMVSYPSRPQNKFRNIFDIYKREIIIKMERDYNKHAIDINLEAEIIPLPNIFHIRS